MAFLKSHPILVRGCLILAKLRVVIGSRTANIRDLKGKYVMHYKKMSCSWFLYHILIENIKETKKQYKPSCG